jgi:hypothetical protein
MGFSFKVAPGVRIRVSSKGVRTSPGPRSGQVRAGGGGNGSPAATGPGALYTSMDAARRSSPDESNHSSVATTQRQVRAAEKAQQAQELAYAFNTIMNLHRESYPPAQSPVAPAATTADEGEIRARHDEGALKGEGEPRDESTPKGEGEPEDQDGPDDQGEPEDQGELRRGARTKARQAAQQAADQEIAQVRADSDDQRGEVQQQLDRQWTRLCSNDPDLVLSVLADAFAENEAPATAVGVDGSAVALVVLVPGPEAVPERLPGRTEAGNLTLRRLTKTMRSALYAQLVAGYVLTTIREAFAVAPGLTEIRVAAIRAPGDGSRGGVRAECLLAARFARSALQGVRWDLVEATAVLSEISSELLVSRRGAARELQPLDLAGEPELADLLTKVEIE